MFPPLTVFDVETTGLDPRQGHKIIEIAGVRIEDGAIKEDRAFDVLVNPEREVPWDARQVNRIKDNDLIDAPTIDQVLPRFLEFAAGTTLVAHNAPFDLSFLEIEKECCWGYVELPECLCTLALSRALYPQENWHNLDALTRRFNLDMPHGRHRALPDVILTAQSLLIMMEEGKIHSFEKLKELAGMRQWVR